MGRTGEIDIRTPEQRPKIIGPGMALAIVALLILLAFGYCATKLVPGAFLGPVVGSDGLARGRLLAHA